ncbi:MAG: hypothetical protein KTR18_17065 [Acidiferrobacterales bacterium]|nr:hypothetical protein [Acidiferrobacterales bacterium]
MHIWLILIGGSTLAGYLTAIFIKTNWAIYVAGALPWFALLGALIYTEYLTSYEGGGASMWLVAQLFGGTIAAAVGVISYKLTRYAQRI